MAGGELAVEALLLLALLVCPLTMVAAMFLMMRGMRGQDRDRNDDAST